MNQSNSTESCSTCRYFREVQGSETGTIAPPGLKVGTCRRFPPIPKCLLVTSGSWCGEWKSTEEKKRGRPPKAAIEPPDDYHRPSRE